MPPSSGAVSPKDPKAGSFLFGCTVSLLLCIIFSIWGEQQLLSSFGHMAYHCSRFSCCEALAVACPSPTPNVFSNSHPPIWWYLPSILSSVFPFSSRLHFPSISVCSSESPLCVRWPDYWSFSFSISPSNEYSGLISFRIVWFDSLSKGIWKSLLQHHSSKAWILQHSAFFMVQISHPYVTTGKTMALPRKVCLVKAVLGPLLEK